MILADAVCSLSQTYNDVLGLFTCSDTLCAAVCVAVLAFVLGALLACLICRLTRRCTCAQKDGGRASYQKRPMTSNYVKTPHPAPADGSIEIYVGNLNYAVTDDILRKEFEAYGKVNSARVIINRFNGKSKGFAFVHMADSAEADAAVRALNDKDVMGRRIKCNKAHNA